MARKILMINRVFPPARPPTGRLLFELAAALSDEGHDVTILTTGPQANIKRHNSGIEIIRIAGPSYPRSVFANLILCVRLFSKALFLRKADVIITKTDPPFFVIFGAILAFIKRSKHVHWSQDLYPDILPALDYNVPKPIYKILDGLTKTALKSCHKIVTISGCMKQELLKKSIQDQKIEIIPNWCDRLFLKEPNEGAQAELPMKFRVLYAGNMGRGHPYKTILTAAEMLNKSDPDIEFLFVGNSAAMDELLEERGRKGLENMRFLPFQPRDKLRSLLESGDLHILTLSEQALGKMLPSRIYDIFAVKRPCLYIGPESSDIALILQSLRAGVTIPLDQPEILVNAIRHLRDNGEDWRQLYDGAVKASETYTPDGSIALWLDLIQEV